MIQMRLNTCVCLLQSSAVAIAGMLPSYPAPLSQPREFARRPSSPDGLSSPAAPTPTPRTSRSDEATLIAVLSTGTNSALSEKQCTLYSSTSRHV